MLRLLIPILVLFPSLIIYIWPYLAYFGSFCLLLFAGGFLMFRNTKKSPTKRPQLQITPLDPVKTFSLASFKSPSPLQIALRRFLTLLISSHVEKMIPNLIKEDGIFAPVFDIYLAEKMDVFCNITSSHKIL